MKIPPLPRSTTPGATDAQRVVTRTPAISERTYRCHRCKRLIDCVLFTDQPSEAKPIEHKDSMLPVSFSNMQYL